MISKVKGYQINISKYIGRFGNNILQIVNAIYIGQLTNSKVTIKYHKLINTSLLNKRLDFRINKYTVIHKDKIINNPFLYVHNLNPYPLPTTCNIRNILREYIYPNLNDTLKPNINLISTFNDIVVIHIRSGDVYGSNPNTLYGQPPLMYYVKAIQYEYEVNGYRNFIILTQSPIISIINKLVKCVETLPLIQIKIQTTTQTEQLSFVDDVRTILSASVMIVGNSTFTYVLMMMSLCLKRLHSPNMKIGVIDLKVDEYSNTLFEELILYEFPGYTVMDKWTGSEEQLIEMETYDITSIRATQLNLL